MRILLIEDDVKLCEVLLPSLEEGGFKADCCHSGAEGLELLRRGYYDACILDRMLPELNGLTLLKVIRSEGSHVPVLMLTALDQIGDRVTGLDAGADDYLTKPFDTRELLARLRAICRRPGQIEKVESIACGDIVLDTEQHTLTGLRAGGHPEGVRAAVGALQILGYAQEPSCAFRQSLGQRGGGGGGQPGQLYTFCAQEACGRWQQRKDSHHKGQRLPFGGKAQCLGLSRASLR